MHHNIYDLFFQIINYKNTMNTKSDKGEIVTSAMWKELIKSSVHELRELVPAVGNLNEPPPRNRVKEKCSFARSSSSSIYPNETTNKQFLEPPPSLTYSSIIPKETWERNNFHGPQSNVPIHYNNPRDPWLPLSNPDQIKRNLVFYWDQEVQDNSEKLVNKSTESEVVSDEEYNYKNVSQFSTDITGDSQFWRTPSTSKLLDDYFASSTLSPHDLNISGNVDLDDSFGNQDPWGKLLSPVNQSNQLL